jgi:hypothetical protein
MKVFELPSTATTRVTNEAAHAAGRIFLDVFHALLPWGMWIALTLAGVVLRFGFPHYRLWAAALVALAGAVLAGLDYHLRAKRMTMVGKLIGPATTVAGTVITVIFLTQGFSQLLALVYIVGGVFGCIIWDVWLHHAQTHDIALSLPAAARTAGMSGASVSIRPRPQAPAAPGVPRGRLPRLPRAPQTAAGLTGTMGFEPGEVTPDEAAERKTHFEGAAGLAPGSLTMHPAEDHAAFAEFDISDPHQLDRSRPWPGPSAPGQTVAVPFRLAGFQDGTDLLYDVLPGHHVAGQGTTGSGKTQSWLWNWAAEGITRRDYAGLIIDITKGDQFVGPLRPAMHVTATTEEQALRMLRGVHRARMERLAFLAARHMTEWKPGCGLSYMDCWIEEAADVFSLLARLSKGGRGVPDLMGEWMSDVKAGRSAGIRWNISLQLEHHTEMSTTARAQMGHLCFGMRSRKEAELGLSDAQLKAGCAPQVWGTRYPGKAYLDVPTLDPAYTTMPLRFFDWGRDAAQIAAYAGDYPAAGRPLDDVTGEALENEPAAPASTALPGPGGRIAGSSPAPGNVTQLFGGSRNAGGMPMLAAETMVREELLKWYAAGKTTFTAQDLADANLAERAGKSRTWPYQLMDMWTKQGLLELLVPNAKRSKRTPKTWEMKLTPAERVKLGLEDQEQG